MTTRFFVAIVALMTVFVFCGTAFEADAARFGGGRSFGGSGGFSKPFKSQSLPKAGVTNPSAGQRQPGAAAASPAARPGFGMMGGVLGGLLAGSLIGSLLSGNGFAGGGMMDMLLLALVAYLAFKFFARRRTAQSAETNISGLRMPMPDAEPRTGTMRENTGGMWDTLGGGGSAGRAEDGSAVNVPAGFDQEDFLHGARMLYIRMNDSWDRRDLDDIAEFASRPFMAEISRQAEESPNSENTQILMVNANVVSVVNEAGRETASAFFDVTLREQGSSSPVQVREVWHFVRAAGSQDMWKLDGIQQVED